MVWEHRPRWFGFLDAWWIKQLVGVNNVLFAYEERFFWISAMPPSDYFVILPQKDLKTEAEMVFVGWYLNSIPNDKIFGIDQIQRFAEDKWKITIMMICVFDGVENIVEKGQNAGY